MLRCNRKKRVIRMRMEFNLARTTRWLCRHPRGFSPSRVRHVLALLDDGYVELLQQGEDHLAHLYQQAAWRLALDSRESELRKAAQAPERLSEIADQLKEIAEVGKAANAEMMDTTLTAYRNQSDGNVHNGSN